MSFGEKIASIMQRPGQDPVPKDDIPWWSRYGARILGTFAGSVAIFLGLWSLFMSIFNVITFSLDFLCVLFTVYQMVAGFLLIAIEAPCCCMFIEHVQRLSDTVESRPYWNRAAAYCAIAVPPILICGGNSILACGLIFATGVVYGMMSVGKKAPIEDMRAAAAVNESQNISSSTRSNLVENAQPISITNKPDSNV